MGFTVKELISHHELPGMELAGGVKSANNLIRNVSVIDCPDAFDWLQPGDFVLTSGYIFRNDEALQRKLVRVLSELACAGIGIKIKKYWDEIPRTIIEEADRRALPIVSIPPQYTLNQIQNHIFTQLYNREDTLLQKYFKIHKRLMSYSLSEQTLDVIVANTVELINNPLIFVDSHWRLLSYAEHRENAVPLTEVLTLSRFQPVFPKDFMDSIPKDIGGFKKAIKRECDTAYGEVGCRILPVRADSAVYGYLVAWESVRKLRSVETIALEQAAIIIALERIKTTRVEESRRIMRQDFFSDLLEGRMESTASVYSLAEMNGLSAGMPYTCVVVRLNRFGGTENGGTDLPGLERIQRRLTRLCAEYFQVNHKSACVFARSNNIIVLIRLSERDDLSGLESRYQELIQGLYNTVTAAIDQPSVVIGVGCGCRDIVELKKSFVQAQEAIRISGLVARSEPINWFEKLMVYNILGSGIPREVLKDFCDSSVGLLAEYDRENNTSLLETLEVYLLENQNVSSAAKKLYIHRNTMNYRINKIKALLNTDFDDSEKLLKLQIGIRVMRLVNVLGK